MVSSTSRLHRTRPVVSYSVDMLPRPAIGRVMTHQKKKSWISGCRYLWPRRSQDMAGACTMILLLLLLLLLLTPLVYRRCVFNNALTHYRPRLRYELVIHACTTFGLLCFIFFLWGILLSSRQSDWSLSCDHGLDYAS